MVPKPAIEICIAGPDDAIAAQRGGADRVELNAALALSGLTPSPGSVRTTLECVDIPVIAMLRPRESGFCYSDREFVSLQRDLDVLLAAGVQGVAFGILTADARIDVRRCELLLRQMQHHDAVFHRAFDLVPDALAALETLIQLGVRRVMTSGQAASAAEGTELLRSLQRHAAGRIELLAAGGIRPGNVARLLQDTECQQIHAALNTDAVDPSTGQRTSVGFSAARAADESRYGRTDESQVRALVQAARGEP